MKKKYNILITGGAGYIGSFLSTELIKKGHFVTVIDKLVFGKKAIKHLKNNKNFKLYKKDVSNLNFLKKIINQFDYIIPLAALVGAPLCEKKPKEALQTNLDSIKKMIKIINKDQRIIFLTTNSGYGIGKKVKFCTEKTPLNPISLYGRTKVKAEDIVMKHKNSVSFRLATVFGVSYRMRTDLLVNNFVLTALKKRKLNLYESHFRRNYIGISDVVSAIIFTINNFQRMRTNIYNLGLSSANLTKLDLAKSIKRVIKDLKINLVTNFEDPDKRDYFVSNNKIEKAGFIPKQSLKIGIKDLLIFYKKNKKKIINNY